jgi:hypothetical protein
MTSPSWLQNLLAGLIAEHDESIRQECPRCKNRDIDKLDMRKVACSWVSSTVSYKALFGQKGYFKDGNPDLGPPAAWDSVFEREMVNYDADFKRIISFLKNKMLLDHSFRLTPDVCKSDEGSGPFKFKAYYPALEEALRKKIPHSNLLRVIRFLRQE